MNTEKIRQMFESMSPKKIEEINRLNHEEYIKQSTAFKEGYEKGNCYLCEKPFKTISKNTPCLHWLLRQCKFRKNDFPKVFMLFYTLFNVFM